MVNEVVLKFAVGLATGPLDIRPGGCLNGRTDILRRRCGEPQRARLRLFLQIGRAHV